MTEVVVTQLIVDAKGAEKGVADFEASMARAKKSAVDAGEATASSFEKAQQRWEKSLMAVDPVLRAQIKMKEALARQDAISADAVRLGIATQEEAMAQFARVRDRQEEYIRRAREGTLETGRWSGAIGSMTGILRTFGITLTAVGLERFAASTLKASVEGKQALGEMEHSFQHFKESVTPIVSGITTVLAHSVEGWAGILRVGSDAIRAALPSGDDTASRFEKELQRSFPLATRAEMEQNSAFVKMDREISEHYAHLANEMKLKSLETARLAAEDMSRLNDEVWRALDETDKALAVERARRRHDETQEEIRNWEALAAVQKKIDDDAARQKDAALKSSLDASIDEFRDYERQEKERARAAAQPWEDMFRHLDREGQKALSDIFYNGKLNSQDFFDFVRRGWSDLLAALVQEQFLRPLELKIVGSLQGGLGGIFSGGGTPAGLSGLNLASQGVGAGIAAPWDYGFPDSVAVTPRLGATLSGGVSSYNGAPAGAGGGFGGFNLGGLFGGGASAYPFPSSVPITPNQMTGLYSNGLPFNTLGGGLSTALGGGLSGLGIGSLVGALGIGNSTGSTIGGGIGGVVGSIIPGIGTIVGSIAGSLLGGLFGNNNPSNYTAVARFNSDLTGASFGGDKPNEQTTSAIQGVAGAIEQSIAALKGYGLSFSKALEYVAIGQRDASYYRFVGGQNVSTGTVGDANDLALKAVRALINSSSGGSANLRTAIAGASSLDDINTRAQFVTQTYDVIVNGTGPLSSFQNEMKTLIASFHDGSEKARAYGLSVADFTAGFARSFDENVRQQLLGISSPMEAAIDLWKRDAQARLDAAAELGADIVQVKALNDQLYGQINKAALDTLRNFRDTFSFGSASAAAPGEQLFGAASAYNKAKDAALAGGDVGAFTSMAANYLGLARNYYGTSEKYGAIYRGADAVASQLQDRLSMPPPALDITPMVQATASGTAVLAERLDTVAASLDAIREDNRQNQAILQTFIRRMA